MNVKAHHWAICSWCRYVYLLYHDYYVLDMFKHFIAIVETQLEWKLRTLRTNQDHGYRVDEMNSYNVVFLKDEFPSIWWNLKRNLNCMVYSKTFNHLSARERICILTKSLKMTHLPYPKWIGRLVCLGEWGLSSIFNSLGKSLWEWGLSSIFCSWTCS